jgi:hypothetical protein
MRERTSVRKGRKGFAKDAKEQPQKWFYSALAEGWCTQRARRVNAKNPIEFLVVPFASFAEPLRPLRTGVLSAPEFESNQ